MTKKTPIRVAPSADARAARPWMNVARPSRRSLRIYSRDPSNGSYLDNTLTVDIPWEPVQPGPTGAHLSVVDYDGACHCYYPPVDLEHPHVLARDGLDPSESDPRFHQQMVYAVASKTVEMFEVALGRKIHWRRGDRTATDHDKTAAATEDIRRLHLFPHAMQEPNAYYSRDAHGILFGYFRASPNAKGNILPGQRVFTCLSYDIVAHEVTHAVIDGIRAYFTEPTNPDVLAFHEGFADLAALFAHFTQHDALVDAIQRTGGRIYQQDLAPIAPVTDGTAPTISAQARTSNPLVDLAQQFGQARAASRGLRSALGTPATPDAYKGNPQEPHTRGAILVAAVFDAYFTVYTRRTADFFRIFRAGGGRIDGDELPTPLANQLAHTAAELARCFFQLCARALDYCPPVDVTFGDFLRALVTVASELHPRDRDGIRDALKQGFRQRGIYPDSASFFSNDALRWPEVDQETIPPIEPRNIALAKNETLKSGLKFGNPNGLTKREKDINGEVLRDYFKKNAAAFGLDPTLNVAVPSFHPKFHVGEDGALRLEMIVEAVQHRDVAFDPKVPEVGQFPMRGGATVVISAPSVGDETETCHVRMVIAKPLHGAAGAEREKRQRRYVLSQGLAHGDAEDATHFGADFQRLHEER
ncbi:MAG: hypothetical protein JNK05_35885 [Myxococcales bacterium]|nr:hypothetical protein [Myxococcales bacterium]